MGKPSVYADHAATTPLRAEVLEAMLPFLTDQWGNPSALYGPARAARRALDNARGTVAAVFASQPDEVVFTASGSEGANLAIKGVMFAPGQKRTHLVTTRVEHHAVLDTCAWLASLGTFQVTYLDVDAHGVVDLHQLEEAVTDHTALVSVMYANNEVGTIQPIQEAARIAHSRGALFHTDAVQAAPWLSLDVGRLGVDLLSIAAHKLNGPRGVGALYVRRGIRLAPLIHGGGQERGRRSGTENVAGGVGLARALDLTRTLDPTRARIPALARRLLDEVPALVPGCRVTGHPTLRLPNHASFVFQDVEIAPVLVGLDAAGICASSGSACTSASSEPSHVLAAMRVPRRDLFGALRLTLGHGSDVDDVDRVIEVLPSILDRVRRRRPALVAV